MVDEDGNFIFIPLLIGAAVGAYQGYQTAKARGVDDGLGLFSFALLGASLGAAAGGIGAGISSAGFIGANTLSLAASSSLNSIGNYVISGTENDITTNLGFGSINWSKGKYENINLNDNKNSGDWLSDLSGLYSNVGDFVQGLNVMKAPQTKLEKLASDAESMGLTNEHYGRYGGGKNPPGKLFNRIKPIDDLDNTYRLHDLEYAAVNAKGVQGAFFNPASTNADLNCIARTVRDFGKYSSIQRVAALKSMTLFAITSSLKVNQLYTYNNGEY